jgi:hypothetical protein
MTLNKLVHQDYTIGLGKSAFLSSESPPAAGESLAHWHCLATQGAASMPLGQTQKGRQFCSHGLAKSKVNSWDWEMIATVTQAAARLLLFKSWPWASESGSRRITSIPPWPSPAAGNLNPPSPAFGEWVWWECSVNFAVKCTGKMKGSHFRLTQTLRMPYFAVHWWLEPTRQ